MDHCFVGLPKDSKGAIKKTYLFKEGRYDKSS